MPTITIDGITVEGDLDTLRALVSTVPAPLPTPSTTAEYEAAVADMVALEKAVQYQPILVDEEPVRQSKPRRSDIFDAAPSKPIYRMAVNLTGRKTRKAVDNKSDVKVRESVKVGAMRVLADLGYTPDEATMAEWGIPADWDRHLI